MITAVDTNVLIDIFGADRTYGQRSKRAVRQCIMDGRLIACSIVFAELGCAFSNGEQTVKATHELGLEHVPLELSTAILAGEAYRAYRAKGGKRDRIIADFLIGAHALKHADRLLTRDRGFHRSYFRSLKLMEP